MYVDCHWLGFVGLAKIFGRVHAEHPAGAQRLRYEGSGKPPEGFGGPPGLAQRRNRR